jgi:flavin reductase (DIM6/NTAB) family NADH-FMN oxidoreductase RutF
MNLTPAPSTKISAPIIAESPISIEYEMKEITEQGSHHMFLTEVVNVQADSAFINKNGAFDISKPN